MDLEESFRTLGPRLYRYALAILGSASSADAEEAVQDAFVSLAETKIPPREEAGWLIRAVRNGALKRLGRSRRRLQLLREGMPLLLPREAGDPVDAEMARRASEAMAKLPAEQREAVALHLFEGLSFREIGEATEVAEDTAASRYRYGIAKMKEMLDERA